MDVGMFKELRSVDTVDAATVTWKPTPEHVPRVILGHALQCQSLDSWLSDQHLPSSSEVEKPRKGVGLPTAKSYLQER